MSELLVQLYSWTHESSRPIQVSVSAQSGHRQVVTGLVTCVAAWLWDAAEPGVVWKPEPMFSQQQEDLQDYEAFTWNLCT